MMQFLLILSGLLIVASVGIAVYDAVHETGEHLWMSIVLMNMVAVMHFYLHVGGAPMPP